jgi:hypothetical protein
LRIARERENATKKPKREASALLLLILEFIKNALPRIDKLGRLYSIPSGAAGRSAVKQAAVKSSPEAFIAKHLPNYPYSYVPNPDIRALQTNAQGIWSSESKPKAMQQFTVPEGLRILVICPEIFYRLYIEKKRQFCCYTRWQMCGGITPLPPLRHKRSCYF